MLAYHSCLTRSTRARMCMHARVFILSLLNCSVGAGYLLIILFLPLQPKENLMKYRGGGNMSIG